MGLNIPRNAKGFTYIQSADPTTTHSVENGDTWFNDSTGQQQIYHNDAWLNILYSAGYYGYNIGGYSVLEVAYLSSIERITFPFDSGTASVVGNMAYTTMQNISSGCNSSEYGYTLGNRFASGAATWQSYIERLTFPFSSGSASHVGNLSKSNGYNAQLNSSSHGYTIGGETQDDALISDIERITFPFDSGTATKVGVASQWYRSGAGFNSSTHGFANFGQYTSTTYSGIDRIVFPFDSGTATQVGNVTATLGRASNHNSSTHGYICGGISVGNYYKSFVHRVTFPFNSGTASAVGNLNNSKNVAAGTNSTGYGYVAGGQGGASYFSEIERIAFPFDSGTATTVGNLSIDCNSGIGCDETDFVGIFV